MSKISKKYNIYIPGVVILLVILMACIITKIRYENINKPLNVSQTILKRTNFLNDKFQNADKEPIQRLIQLSEPNDELNILIGDSLIYGDYKYIPINNDIPWNQSTIQSLTNGVFFTYQFRKNDSTIQIVSPIFRPALVHNLYFYNHFPFQPLIHQTYILGNIPDATTIDTLHLLDSNQYLKLDNNLQGKDLSFNINTYLVLLFVFVLFCFLYAISRNELKVRGINSLPKVWLWYLLTFLSVYFGESLIALRDIGIFKEESYASDFFIKSLAQLYYFQFGMTLLLANMMKMIKPLKAAYNKSQKKYLYLILGALLLVLINNYFVISYFNLIYNSTYHSFLIDIYPVVLYKFFYIFILLILLYPLFSVYHLYARVVTKTLPQVIGISISIWLITILTFSLYHNEYRVISYTIYILPFLLVSILPLNKSKLIYISRSAFAIGNTFWLIYYLSICIYAFTFISNEKTKKTIDNYLSYNFVDYDPVIVSKIDTELKEMKKDSNIQLFIDNPHAFPSGYIQDYIANAYFQNDLFTLNKNIFYKINTQVKCLTDSSRANENDLENWNYLESTETYADYSLDGDNSIYGAINFKISTGEVFELLFKFTKNEKVNESYVFKNILKETTTKELLYAEYNPDKTLLRTNSSKFPDYMAYHSIKPDTVVYHYYNDFVLSQVNLKNHNIFVESDYYNLNTKITLYFILFFLFASIYLIQQIFVLLVDSQFKIKNIINFYNLSFYSRIFYTISMLMLLVIISISIIISNLYTNSNIAKYETNFQQNIVIITKLFSELNSDYDTHQAELQTIKLVKQFGYDFNLYDLNGKLSYSTNRQIFTKQIKSDYLPSDILNQIRNNHQHIIIRPDAYGTYKFNSGDSYVKNVNSGKEYIINVLNLSYQDQIRNEINIFVNQVSKIIFIVLMLSLLFSYLLTFNFNKGLTTLVSQIKKLDLTKPNQSLSWSYNDEIGKLVEEYNIMLKRVEQNIKVMADTERNLAWKDMARQIAHEVKNPLTPMKLNIQHLKKLAQNNPEKLPELTEKISNGLIQQIDQLAEISNDFSFFSQISSAEKSPFIFNELIASVEELYSNYDSVNIKIEIPSEEIHVVGNQTQLMKVYINLIKNAIEALEDTENPTIEVKHVNRNQKISVFINDNAKGITLENRAKIFKPNFTTKSSGSGLGLIICKNIIEYHDGQIGFLSELGQGTTFYFILPLVSDETPVA